MLKLQTHVDYSVIELDSTKFFVVGRCTTGSRHYSELIFSFSESLEKFNLYKDLVDYFGGGTVELWAVDGYTELLIKHKHI